MKKFQRSTDSAVLAGRESAALAEWKAAVIAKEQAVKATGIAMTTAVAAQQASYVAEKVLTAALVVWEDAESRMDTAHSAYLAAAALHDIRE